MRAFNLFSVINTFWCITTLNGRRTANDAKLTKISITGFAKLPPASKAKVKWKLILLPQLATILNSIKRILFAVVCNKAVVVSEITGVLAIL